MGSPKKDKVFTSKMELKRFVLTSIDSMVELLSTLNHHKRLEILASMLDGNTMEFSDLLEATGLQKSALSNHLTVLTDKSLLEKRERGVYQITLDGEALIEDFAETFLTLKIREQQRLNKLLKSIGKPVMKYEVNNVRTEELEFKVVQLSPTKVVSFQAISVGLGTPEPKAWKKLLSWAKPKGLFDDPQNYQVYGFNNPCPPEIDEHTEYGYEFLLTIPDDFEVESNIVTKDLPGGLYGVMSCKGVKNIGPTWGKLSEAIKKNEEYQYDGNRQWLEHHHVRLDDMTDDDILLDCYAPIKNV